ncbi:trichothecene efflux pump [Stagonosporopsis vannaccii]|nr:trichothecene efflux pump [Stagonosporopsis vannaccii]
MMEKGVSVHSEFGPHSEAPSEDRNEPETTVVPSANYYTSSLFLGTIVALGMSMMSGTGAYSLIAPIMNVVNEDIGPDPNYIWLGLVNTLMQAVGFTLVGRLSDLFGRRWFVICGNFLGVLGAIISATAKDIPSLIGGNVFLGLATSVQTSVPFILGELIPMKHRFLATGGMYFWVLPGAVFGPAISYAFVTHTAAGWRWVYYLLIITNTIATTCWFFFYHPPTFRMISAKSRLQMIKDFDWVGFVLFTGSLLVLLMGLSWGGTVHPWKSSWVIGTIVCGGLSLVAFGFWQSYMPLKEPLVPRGLFKNRAWLVVSIVGALSASIFFGFAIVFPQLVFGVWTTDQTYGSILACALPGAYTAGVIISALVRYVGHFRVQAIVCSVLTAGFLGAAACLTVDNKVTVILLLIIGSVFAGILEGISVTSASLTAADQSDIGAAVGICSTMRAGISTFATTIYLVVLQNRLATTIPALLPPAVVGAGLPVAEVPAFLTALTTGTLARGSAYSEAVVVAGVAAYREAQVGAFKTVFYVTLLFSGSCLVLSFFWPNMDQLMRSDVVALLRNSKEEKEAIVHIENVRKLKTHAGHADPANERNSSVVV